MPDVLEQSVCAARTKAAADSSELLKIKHMAARCLDIANQRPEHRVWLFYLPDFTAIFKDWYGCYVDAVVNLYDRNSRFTIQREPDFLRLDFFGRRPSQIISNLVENGCFEEISKLLAAAIQARCKCQLQLDAAEKKLQAGRIPDRTLLINTVTEFSAYGLDQVFPERILIQHFPGVEPARLYFTPISSWAILIEKVIEGLEQIYLQRASESEIIGNYAKRFSHLRWGDIEHPNADLYYSEKIFASYKLQFPGIKNIWQMREERKQHRRFYGSSGANYTQYLENFRKTLNPGSIELFDALAHFAAEAQQYNEWRRILFTKSLRLIREIAFMQNQNFQKVSLVEFLKK